MKLSHRQLEIIRANPKKYKSILEGSTGGFPRLSKYACWKHAVNYYYKSGKDLNKTESYFVQMFEKNFVQNRRNVKEMEDYLNDINQYVNDFNELGNDIVDTKVRIALPIGNGHNLSGEIHRIDMSLSGGYEVYLIIKEDNNWEDELRFPLMQHYFAEYLGCPYDEVSVGVYCFQRGEHTVNKYSQKDIENALNEVDKISRFLE